MSEGSNPPSPWMAETAASAGALLRRAREDAGLSAAGLAQMLKVPVERLLALEEGRYEVLPNLTFVRALAASVCRVLKIDPAPVLQGLPQASQVDLGPDQPLPRPNLALGRGGLAWPRHLSWRSPPVLAAGVLGLAAALWTWLPPYQPEPTETSARPATQVMESVLVPPSTPAGVPPVVSPDPVTAPPPSPSTDPALTVAQTPVPLVPLHLQASATTWIQLQSPSGKVVQQRTLQPEQTLDYDGELPIQVILGRPAGVQVWVRGQPFDLSSYPANKVARFEVK